MIKYLFFFTLTALLNTACQAISLQELEQSLLVNERRMQISTQDTRIASALFQQREAESGWKAFANANGGSTTGSLSSPGMQQNSSQYGTYGYTAGLSYPLLGTQTTQQKRITEAKKQLETSKYEFETVKRQALQDLRQSYIDLWVSQQQVILARSYLDRWTQTSHLLASRKNAGLLLSSDEKEFQAGFAEVDAQKSLALQLNTIAKKTIFYLTGVPVEELNKVDPPNFLIKAHHDPERASRQPELQAAKLRLDIQREYASKADWEGVEASMDLTYNDGRQYWNPTVPSSNALVAFNVRIPFELAKYQKGAREETQANLEKLRIESEEREARYVIDSETALMNYRQAINAYKVSELERSSAKQALEERTLRAQSLPGDVIEKKIQARYAYYKAASKQLNHWRAGQLASIQLASLGFPLETSTKIPPTDLTESISPPQEPQSKRGIVTFEVPTGVYVWSSSEALNNPKKISQEWQQFGISKVLIGLNSKQLADKSLASSLTALIQIAHDSQIQVEIVLGDSSWILPEGRAKLTELLKRLSSIPADGINLDLEIEQLPNWSAQRDQLTQEWLATLQAASKSTTIPMGATFHHRHLDIPNLGSKLQEINIKNVAVMIFTTDEVRILEVSAKARASLEGMPYSIVQSVERHLPTGESYANLGLKPLIKLSKELRKQGSPSLLIQSWSNLKTLSP
jgi:outer membrane protein TolC